MKLRDLGYTEALKERHFEELQSDAVEIARVISEHRERYVVVSENGEFSAEVTGTLRFSALERSDFPAVGDWVTITVYDDSHALIHKVLPRKSMLRRRAAGSSSQDQIIGTNIDYALIVQALDRDYNPNRLERYLILCRDARVMPIIVFSKCDLLDQKEVESLLKKVRSANTAVVVTAVTNQSADGYSTLSQHLEIYKTYCVLGSSGVGKSTLINHLGNKDWMQTAEISGSTHKGKHTTSHRQLIVLPNGSILIDNPGMREVGLSDTSSGLKSTFQDIEELAAKCKFNNCSHEHEAGCAILKALDNEQIDQQSYTNYLKMQREISHYQSSVAERRRKERKFGRMAKDLLKTKRREIDP